jgi:hypothetical protein
MHAQVFFLKKIVHAQYSLVLLCMDACALDTQAKRLTAGGVVLLFAPIRGQRQ